MKKIDRVIIGSGIFGLYAALQSLKKGYSALILERDKNTFMRASFVNQARVHNGYHYTRSYNTAKKSREYFLKFIKDYEFAILKKFKKIYAVSTKFSYVNNEQFVKFCEIAKIPCSSIIPDKYFKKGLCSGAFEVEEYTFDAKKNPFIFNRTIK